MLKEEEIRPKKAESQYHQLRLQDIQKIFLNKKGDINNKFFIDVGCPACGGDSYIKEFIKEKFTFKRCRICNTLYVSPRPKPERLHKYYCSSKSMEFFTKEILETTVDTRKEKILKPRAKKVISYIEKLNILRGLFVEIGGQWSIFGSYERITRWV